MSPEDDNPVQHKRPGDFPSLGLVDFAPENATGLLLEPTFPTALQVGSPFDAVLHCTPEKTTLPCDGGTCTCRSIHGRR